MSELTIQPLPWVPARLRREITHYQHLPADWQRSWQPTFDPDAETAAAAMAAERQPASSEAIVRWLSSLASACASTLTPEQLRARVTVILNVLGNVPQLCWTEATLAKAALTFRYFPTVAELGDLLGAIDAAHQAAINLLLRMAQAELPTQNRESRIPYPVQPAYTEDAPRRADTRPPHRSPEQQIAELLGPAWEHKLAAQMAAHPLAPRVAKPVGEPEEDA